MFKKNPIVRYKIIDELLSSSQKRNMTSLLEKVNERLEDLEMEPICRRTLELDLRALENPPYYAEISRENRIVTYVEKGFSVFTKQLSEEETSLLKEVLGTIGQFDGLPNFSWLDGLKNVVDKAENKSRQIIKFSSNDQLRNKNLLADLYDAISNKKVIKIEFAPFDNSMREFIVHPYLLKEYNNRWFLFGYAVEQPNNKIHNIFNFAIDRIQKVERIVNRAYNEEMQNKMDAYFDNIIGVTNFDDKPILDITFWANQYETNYILSKPIHPTQIEAGKVEDRNLRHRYPHLTDGKFFHIKCKDNFELQRELIGHFAGIIVLEPRELKESLRDKLDNMMGLYNNCM